MSGRIIVGMRKSDLNDIGHAASRSVGRSVHIGSHDGPWPLHDAASTKALEQAAQLGAPQPPLMARAGLAVARLARALAPHASRSLVLVGPGNNGGDGLVAARLLHTARHPVSVRLAADPARLPPDAAHALRLAASAGVDIQTFKLDESMHLGPQDRVIDALLGIGSRNAPRSVLAHAIAACNGWPAMTLAIDLPSGLHPDTGALLGPQAVRAHATLALLTLKPGCFTAQGRDHAGLVWWNDLAVPTPPPVAWLGGPPDPLWRPHAAHKGRFGDVLLVGGAPGMEGAVVLAAAAALAAGAGRVYACRLSAVGAGPAMRPEIMMRNAREVMAPATLGAATVVAGCGGGDAVAAHLPALLAHAARLVLDADALNAIAADAGLRAALQSRGRRRTDGMVSVLTPHPLEAARLLDCTSDSVQADRVAAATRLAEEFQAVVVLKGSGTVVTCPAQLPWINPTGNAALGSAGTGDVLAGWLGGIWAQTHTGDVQAAAQAARTAVWRHGEAADRHLALGYTGPLRAAELIEMM